MSGRADTPRNRGPDSARSAGSRPPAVPRVPSHWQRRCPRSPTCRRPRGRRRDRPRPLPRRGRSPIPGIRGTRPGVRRHRRL